MSRTKAALPLAACTLLLAAGCSGKSGATGSGSLQQEPSQTPTGTVAPTTASPSPTAQPTRTHTQTPPPSADCVSYNPANLTVDGSGASGTFLVEDGSTIVIRAHGQDD